MKGSILLIVGGLAAGGLGAPTAVAGGGHVVHERRSVNDGSYGRWIKREPLDPDTKLPVRLALKQRNLDKGMGLIMEV